MSLPSIQLDDRTFREIADEAIRLIPRYCPEWTNHNPSDPGIALIEVFAHMVEGLLWRMNRLPEKATLEYLRLLGHRLLPGRASRAPVTFHPVEEADPSIVPEGTVISTRREKGGSAICFETEREIALISGHLERCISKVGDRFTDLTKILSDGGAVKPFLGASGIERFLYLGDPRWKSLRGKEVVALEDEVGGLADRVAWEYFTGAEWRPLPAVAGASGEAVFSGPIPGIEAHVVAGHAGWWVRGRPARRETRAFKNLRLRAFGSGLPPDHLASDREGTLQIPIDTSRPFHPFGPAPIVGSTFLIGSSRALARWDSLVKISIDLAEPLTSAPPSPSGDLLIVWEYWSGDRWAELGRSRPAGNPPPSGHRFVDTTAAFSRSGVVSFVMPEDLAPIEVAGSHMPAVRARIEQGDYGIPGRFEPSGSVMAWKEDRPILPPRIEAVRLDYTQVSFAPERALSYNDFVYRDQSESLRDGREIRPFEIHREHSPAFYLGFSEPFPEGRIALYFRLSDEPGTLQNGPRVAWEIRGADGWDPLPAEDGSAGFLRSGTLSFVAPVAHVRASEFGQDLYWIRGRLVSGTYPAPPEVAGIHPNTTIAVQGFTIRDEILGHGDSSTHQTFRLSSTPILSIGSIEVRERVEEGGPPGWTEVESLALADGSARVFELNPVDGSVRFGDGSRGLVPPRGEIKVNWYRTGEGSAGNLGARTITVIRHALSEVDSISNPYPAEGGADPEGPAEAASRAVRQIRNQDRAVTADDFESLALASSRWVARAYCIPDGADAVTLVILPTGDPRRRPGQTLSTPVELLEEVHRYLDERRLISTRVRCRGPSFIDIEVSLKVAPARLGVESASLPRVIEDGLRRLLDPLLGGPDGRGWRPGRAVTRAEVHETVGRLPEVRYVEEVHVFSPGMEGSSARLEIPPHAIPIVSRVRVSMADTR
ncbi:MAG: putative baseplate assembly protein [Planctomycetota bacterium]|nr:putative baseplate assembly protein [Planctomycetota bacterium]